MIAKLPSNIRITSGVSLGKARTFLYGVLPDGRLPITPRYQRRLYRPGRGRWGGVLRMFYTPAVAGLSLADAERFVRGCQD
jgi:hypothetical protein